MPHVSDQQAVKGDGVDGMMHELLALVGGSRDKLITTWAQGADVYARYLTALSEAKGPEDVLAANAEFVRAGSEIFSAAAQPADLDGKGHEEFDPVALPE